MGYKIKKIFLLIILILLQSCSGGRIGNFLESSFKYVEEPRIEKDNKNNFKKKIVIKSDLNDEKNKNIIDPKKQEDNKNNFKKKIVIKSEEKSKNNKKIVNQDTIRQKRKFQPQSYKIIFILKDVDPKDPIEDLSTILRNSDVNFEIEKIERFFDSKNKNIKRN